MVEPVHDLKRLDTDDGWGRFEAWHNSKKNVAQKESRSLDKTKNEEVVMKRYGVGFLVLFFVAFCVLAAVSPVHSQEVIKLKYANFFPPMHTMSIMADEWCKEVEKRTNGKVKITYLPGGTLIPAAQAYEGAVKGIADISMMTQQYNAGRFPLTEVMYLPIRSTSAHQASKMINVWYDKFKPKEYDDVKILYLYNGGPGNFATLKPITSINDLKGLKIRGAGDTAKIISAMGAVPVSIPLADSYEGFQRGIIQGSVLPVESLKGWKFGDLLKGLQINDAIGNPSALGVVMNKKSWASLPPDVQKVIEQVNKEWVEKTGVAWDKTDKEGIDYGISKGMKIFKISKEEQEITAQKMKPLLDEYVANMKKLGLPGEESLKFILDFIKNNP
jgi:TRAP-type C4-dicarboxylate transport system substrate-binding protein